MSMGITGRSSAAVLGCRWSLCGRLCSASDINGLAIWISLLDKFRLGKDANNRIY
jgi:hypothetical protein